MPGGMDSQRNWIVLTAIYASLAAVAMLFCFACVRERVQVLDEYGEEKIPLKKAIPAEMEQMVLPHAKLKSKNPVKVAICSE